MPEVASPLKKLMLAIDSMAEAHAVLETERRLDAVRKDRFHDKGSALSNARTRVDACRGALMIALVGAIPMTRDVHIGDFLDVEPKTDCIT